MFSGYDRIIFLKYGKKKFDLEVRLVNYTCRMIDVVEALPGTRAGNYIAGQLIKSRVIPQLLIMESRAGSGVKRRFHS